METNLGVGPVDWVVLEAAEEWGESNHHLFPLPARLASPSRSGADLSRFACLARQWPGMDDMWMTCVLPKAMTRCPFEFDGRAGCADWAEAICRRDST